MRNPARISEQRVSTAPLRNSTLTPAADRSNYPSTESILSSTPHTVTGDSNRRDTTEEESVLQDVDYFIRALGDGSLNDIQNATRPTDPRGLRIPHGKFSGGVLQPNPELRRTIGLPLDPRINSSQNDTIASSEERRALFPLPQKGDEVRHEKHRGVVQLYPTTEQSQDLPKLIKLARSLGADKIGFCKVNLPWDGPDYPLAKPANNIKVRTNRFSICPQIDGTFKVSRNEHHEKLLFGHETSFPTAATDNELVQRFEALPRNPNGFQHVRYYCDLDALDEHQRKQIGLPPHSPIFPLKENRLSETKVTIPGIHWPYAYVSNDEFGAPFALHVEDCHLASINYLYTGEKVWFIVEPQSGRRLEEKLVATGVEKRCSQFLRHSARYVPRSLLDAWGISYKVIRQLPNEIIITLPGAYHQGFSTGFTCAEAVNYAESDWSTEQYQFCSDRCPDGSIQAPMMALVEHGEPQEDQSATSDDANQNVAAVSKQATGNGAKRKASDAILPTGTKEAAAKRPQLRKPQLKDMTLSPRFSGALDEFKDVTRALLFCTIGSPEAMVQLRKACAALRDRSSLPPDHRRTSTTTGTTITACQAMLSLDRLDNQDFAVQVLRRFYLVRLVRWRKNAEVATQLQKSNNNQRAVRKCAQERLPRYQTMVLEDLMAQAYPYLTDKSDEGYKSRYKSLQNRISSGNNWYLLAEEFGEGILALVPTSDLVPNSS